MAVKSIAWIMSGRLKFEATLYIFFHNYNYNYRMMTCWLIDDNEIDLLITRKLIKTWQPTLSVQEFTNARVALDKLDNGEEPPQLIFLDLFMPEVSGYDFLDHYQRFNYPNTLLYVLSSSIDDADIDRVRTYPVVNGYLSKPIGKESFERIMALRQRAQPERSEG